MQIPSRRILPTPYTILKPKPETENELEPQFEYNQLEKSEKEKIAALLFPHKEDS